MSSPPKTTSKKTKAPAKRQTKPKAKRPAQKARTKAKARAKPTTKTKKRTAKAKQKPVQDLKGSLQRAYQWLQTRGQNAAGAAKQFFHKHFTKKRLALYTLGSGALGFILVAGFLGLGAVYYARTLPDPLLQGLGKQANGYVILAADKTVLYKNDRRLTHVTLVQMAPSLPKAVIAIEDKRFYDHFGFDPIGFSRAMVRNLMAGRVVQGGSTLTQQLAKNLYLKSDRTYLRKAKELMIALWLEHKFSKNDILELYLNRVYLGNGAYGVEAASHRYFNIPSRKLSIAQSALIAGLLKAPNQYAPTKNSVKAQKRMRLVLAALKAQEKISHNDYKTAILRPPIAVNRQSITQAGYATDWIGELIPQFAGSIYADLVVETTIDPMLQDQATLSLQTVLSQNGLSKNAQEGALVMVAPDGAVKALVGGFDYTRNQFNRAVKAKRQPGSTFKPFVYLSALEAGYTPQTTLKDAPIRIGKWRPKNAHGGYRGAMSLSDALTHSVNTIPVRLSRKLGLAKIAKTAKRLGVTSPLDLQPSLPLGTSAIPLVELTGAYAPFANGGYRAMPYVIKRIKTTTGETLYTRTRPRTKRIMKRRHLSQMNHMLRNVVRKGTGKRARLAFHDSAGKTGTSQNNRDALFIGYTAHYITGVWVGNDDNSPMKKVYGGTLPALIWNDFMTQAHIGKPTKSLPGTHNASPTLSSLSDLIRATKKDETARPVSIQRKETSTRTAKNLTSWIQTMFGGKQ